MIHKIVIMCYQIYKTSRLIYRNRKQIYVIKYINKLKNSQNNYQTKVIIQKQMALQMNVNYFHTIKRI